MKVTNPINESIEVIVIGGGQSGLSLGYELEKSGIAYLILERSSKIGTSWRSRWDSLKLFTPNPYNDLGGLPFPKHEGYYPTKDEVSEYLADYARKHRLSVEFNCVVTSVELEQTGKFVVETSQKKYSADQVVVATGAFGQPHIPELSASLSPEVLQIHSSQYKNLKQIPEGDVLIVGGGNSGVQISEEVSTEHKVFLSLGKRRPSLPSQIFGRSLFWWLHRSGIIKLSIPWFLSEVVGSREPIIGTNLQALKNRGVLVVGRTLRASGNEIMLAGDARIRVRSVIWATGYLRNYNWINVAGVLRNGFPDHKSGVTKVKGFYFIGIPRLSSARSELLGRVKYDAQILRLRIQKNRTGRLQAALKVKDL